MRGAWSEGAWRVAADQSQGLETRNQHALLHEHVQCTYSYAKNIHSFIKVYILYIYIYIYMI